MRCVNKELSLGVVPARISGSIVKRAECTKWVPVNCKRCAGVMWVIISVYIKYGKAWLCKKCKANDKREINKAILAMAKRRQEIKKRGMKQ